MATTSYFNPEEHLVFHTDKNGQMMSGGYKINNALFEQNIPLFSKWSGGGNGTGGSNDEEGSNNYKNDNSGVSANIIPSKFSDLFLDLAVPAGLFVMPPLFSTRKYMVEQSDDDKPNNKNITHEHSGSDNNSDSDHNEYNESDEDAIPTHKFAPVDIFDKLIALVTPTERIKLDKKTRKHRTRNSLQNKKDGLKTKRSKPSRRNNKK